MRWTVIGTDAHGRRRQHLFNAESFEAAQVHVSRQGFAEIEWVGPYYFGNVYLTDEPDPTSVRPEDELLPKRRRSRLTVAAMTARALVRGRWRAPLAFGTSASLLAIALGAPLWLLGIPAGLALAVAERGWMVSAWFQAVEDLEWSRAFGRWAEALEACERLRAFFKPEFVDLVEAGVHAFAGDRVRADTILKSLKPSEAVPLEVFNEYSAQVQFGLDDYQGGLELIEAAHQASATPAFHALTGAYQAAVLNTDEARAEKWYEEAESLRGSSRWADLRLESIRAILDFEQGQDVADELSRLADDAGAIARYNASWVTVECALRAYTALAWVDRELLVSEEQLRRIAPVLEKRPLDRRLLERCKAAVPVAPP